MPSMEVCQRLMEVRLAWGFSQEEMASRVGVSRHTLRKWELGTTVPSLDALMHWADVLGYTLSIWPKKP